MSDDNDLNLPDALLRDLRSSIVPPTSVPARMDQQVLTGARVHLARRSRWRWVASGVAAAVAIGVTSFYVLNDRPHHAEQVAMDVNGDQQVNILDALAAARRGDAPAAERIAGEVVRLEGVR